MMKVSEKNNQRGFTIVELLIATAVLSTLLVVVSIMMANIGKLYNKGINQAKMQDNVRSVVDEISDRLQLSNTDVGTASDGATKAYCIGTTRYTYVLGQQLTDDPASFYKHVLWRDTVPTGACGKVDGTATANLNNPDPSSGRGGNNGSELITTKSRLSKFSISPTISPYGVTMRLVYGDDDQLDNLAVVGSNPNDPDAICISQSGSQFCATAALSVTVVQRTSRGD